MTNSRDPRTKQGVIEILRKVGPGWSPFELAGVISVKTRIRSAGLLRWVNLVEHGGDGASVFWVGIVNEPETPHILLCHWITDDGETIRLRGIHGDEVFEARIKYSERLSAALYDVDDDAEILAGLAVAARTFRVIGPEAGDKEVAPVLNLEAGEEDLYL